jgi:Protein of unknown function (DUF3050)
MFHWMPWLRSGGCFVFVLGREDVIPEMFKRLLSLWQHGRSRSRTLPGYLKRHRRSQSLMRLMMARSAAPVACFQLLSSYPRIPG